jgi:hypothetical protein
MIIIILYREYSTLAINYLVLSLRISIYIFTSSILLNKLLKWYKIIELFKVRYKLIRLKNLFSMRLLLSKAKL